MKWNSIFLLSSQLITKKQGLWDLTTRRKNFFSSCNVASNVQYRKTVTLVFEQLYNFFFASLITKCDLYFLMSIKNVYIVVGVVIFFFEFFFFDFKEKWNSLKKFIGGPKYNFVCIQCAWRKWILYYCFVFRFLRYHILSCIVVLRETI